MPHQNSLILELVGHALACPSFFGSLGPQPRVSFNNNFGVIPAPPSAYLSAERKLSFSRRPWFGAKIVPTIETGAPAHDFPLSARVHARGARPGGTPHRHHCPHRLARRSQHCLRLPLPVSHSAGGNGFGALADPPGGASLHLSFRCLRPLPLYACRGAAARHSGV